MGIFFEPRPVEPEVVPQAVNLLTDAFAAPPTESYEVAYANATNRVDALAGHSPLLGDETVKSSLTNAVATAWMSPSLSRLNARRRAATVVKAIVPTDPQQQEFQVGRFVAAVAIFAAVAGAALGADAAGLSDSAKAFYGFAASIFGVIVGLLGGESSAKS